MEIQDLISETEALLNDILLSGFQGVYQTSIEQLDVLKKAYEAHGMVRAATLLEALKVQLLKRRNSLSYELSEVLTAYSQVAFYIAYSQA